jgi:LysW-gamma-L-lysine carboxypeptidase
VAEFAVNWWNAIAAHAAAFNQEHSGAFDLLMPSLRQIETHSDGLADTVHAKVGVRLPPDFDIEDYKATVRAFAGDAELAIYGEVPAYRAERNSPLVRAFSAAFREKGLRPRLKVKTGTSDMNTVAPVWGCPIVAYGPGDSSLDHTAEEHLPLDDYRQAIELLTNILEQL